MILGFTGTSNGMTPRQSAAVRQLFSELHLIELHHGDCIGADEQADAEAESLGAFIVVHPPVASVKRSFRQARPRRVVLNPKPYLIRNKDIVVAGGGGLVAAPKGRTEEMRSGTWATVRHARKLGRRIWIVRPDGSVIKEGP